jgi:Tol biopolymer transport system component
MIRVNFALSIFALCCVLAISQRTFGQSSSEAQVWSIGKIVLQADDDWINPAPLTFQAHIRGSGSVVQKRVADHIVIVDSPHSKQREVGIGLEPTLSPDGHNVVYCGRTKAGWQLVKVTTDTGERVELTHLKNTASSPAWSPDGSKIAFNTEAENGGIVGVLDLATNYFSAISPGARPRWSPDGKKLVFLRWPEVADGPQSIWVVNADGTGLKKICDIRGLLPSANWSADGASIIFTSEDQHRSAIFRMDLDGSKVEKIAGDKHTDLYLPSMSPDGRQLVVIADSDMAPTLTLIDLDSHKSRALPKALRASVIWTRNE